MLAKKLFERGYDQAEGDDFKRFHRIAEFIVLRQNVALFLTGEQNAFAGFEDAFRERNILLRTPCFDKAQVNGVADSAKGGQQDVFPLQGKERRKRRQLFGKRRVLAGAVREKRDSKGGGYVFFRRGIEEHGIPYGMIPDRFDVGVDVFFPGIFRADDGI